MSTKATQKRTQKVKRTKVSKGTGSRTRPKTKPAKDKMAIIKSVSDNTLKLKRSEFFASVSVTGGTVKKGHIAFNIANYPAWLKRMTTLYEMISFEKIRFRIISNYATVSSGNYYVGFNSSVSDSINDSTLTSTEIIAQRNSRSANIYSNITVDIPRTTFALPYKRYLCSPTSTDAAALEKTWFFDFLYYFDTASSGNFTIMIDYTCSLYTPAIRD